MYTIPNSLLGQLSGCTQIPSSSTDPLLQKHPLSQVEFLQSLTTPSSLQLTFQPHIWYSMPGEHTETSEQLQIKTY